MTELTSTALAARGLPVIQTESAVARGYEMLEAGRSVDFLQLARELGASHAVIGNVHEYRFKSDLDGAPTVGLSLRLVETATGATVWQGSSSRSSGYYGSLTRTAQGTAAQLVAAMAGKGRKLTVVNSGNRRSSSNRRTTPSSTRTGKPPVEYEQIRRNGTLTFQEPGILPASAAPGTSPYGAAYSPAPTMQPPPPAHSIAPPQVVAPVPSSNWIPVR
jgi:TolB-like protein